MLLKVPYFILFSFLFLFGNECTCETWSKWGTSPKYPTGNPADIKNSILTISATDPIYPTKSLRLRSAHIGGKGIV
eukprot:Pgem_evm1s16410